MRKQNIPFDVRFFQKNQKTIEIYPTGYMKDGDADYLNELATVILEQSTNISLIYILDGFTGFERSILAKHGIFYSKVSSKLSGIAVVNPSLVARFGATTVSLLTRVPIRNFFSYQEAQIWVNSLETDSNYISLS